MYSLEMSGFFLHPFKDREILGVPSMWLSSLETRNMLQESYFYALRFGWLEVLRGKLLWYNLLHNYPFKHMNYASGTYPPRAHYHGSLVEFHSLNAMIPVSRRRNCPEKAGFIQLPHSKFFPNQRTVTAIINVPKYIQKWQITPLWWECWFWVRVSQHQHYWYFRADYYFFVWGLRAHCCMFTNIPGLLL